ncbi:hypothetical protein EDB89DRAFT_2016539 [Lactarius sanguifluus]|nr:hypothetical protein EDB89DRAFT_2016539 [Lactarius sanguifluus]
MVVLCLTTIFSLAVGNHHLEYGLPSTHSTDSISMACSSVTCLRSPSPQLPLDHRFRNTGRGLVYILVFDGLAVY